MPQTKPLATGGFVGNSVAEFDLLVTVKGGGSGGGTPACVLGAGQASYTSILRPHTLVASGLLH